MAGHQTRHNPNGLTDVQQAFADAWLSQRPEDRSIVATWQMIRPNATAQTAAACGSRCMARPQVKAYIERREAEMARQVEEKQLITTEEVIGELKHLALANLTDVLSWDEEGNVRYRTSDELDARGRAAVKGLKLTITEQKSGKDGSKITRRMELTMHDKVRPLELLGKYKELGLFTEKVEHSGEVQGGGLVLLPATMDQGEWQKLAQQAAQQKGPK